MIMKLHLFISVLVCSMQLSCAPDKNTSSHEIGNKADVLAKFYIRAMEPYAIAGEKDEQMILEAMAVLEKEGDRTFSDRIKKLSGVERSAIRIFITPKMLSWDTTKHKSYKYPESAHEIAQSLKKDDWPAVVVSREAMGNPKLSLDEWPRGE